MSENNKDTVILLVDDMPMNIRILGTILKTENYSFAVATNGAETYAILEKQVPDLILLDIMLPDTTGFDICASLKQNERLKDIPIIFLTAKVELEDKVKGFQLGAVDYITKPFEEEEVIVRVRNHLALKHAKDTIAYQYKQLQQTQKELVNLEKKNAALAMAVTANHELNQPLMVLQGNIEMLSMSLQDVDLNPKQKGFLHQIEAGVERISEILKSYKKATSAQFTDYESDTDMVVLDNGNQ